MDEQRKKIEDKVNARRAQYKGPFCCFDMDSMIDEGRDERLYNVYYDSSIREFYLKSIVGPYIRTIQFCPWCGIQLPKELRDEWFDLLEEEYGLDFPLLPEQEKKIPREFQTDEWWKKRGL